MQYAVVDYLWFRSLKGDSNSLGFDLIDKWGRMLPDPERWPSSGGGRGFTDVANKVHSMGLKFGIHLMAGISTQAFNNNTPILDTKTGQPYMESGRTWNAKDIGIPSRTCPWMSNGFMAINATTGAGKAFLRSIYELYASWGVDFVKLDCVFGDNFNLGEIRSVSEILNGFDHSIVFSLSPGVSATPEQAKSVSSLVNAYRVTGDDWDEWSAILAHFDVARDFAASNLIGANGLKGKSWPDLDMLPFGWLTDPAAHVGPHRFTKLTRDEQRTQMTLWSMAKSPIMYGGDLRKIDSWTYDLITNPTLLEIDACSYNNREACETSFSSCLFLLFPHVTTLNDVKTEGHNVTKVPFYYSLALTECTDPKARGWSGEKYSEDPERICYKSPTQDQEKPLCVHERELPIALSKQTLIQSEQTWELKSNGTLVNGHSGMCATVEHVRAKGYPNRIRSWIAAGRRGVIYVAFFNLVDEKTTISANIADLAIAIPGRKRKLRVCAGTEIWSNVYLRIRNTFSIELSAHGCALFVLKCA
uniref:Alpha-galactosidase n=1 Tax=Cajanus cajan TaxID=3821 RepID=A0A151U1H9_CAJCA|nr:Alpha-N-acetylgalactosaminidase [Cajanus cajan]